MDSGSGTVLNTYRPIVEIVPGQPPYNQKRVVEQITKRLHEQTEKD